MKNTGLFMIKSQLTHNYRPTNNDNFPAVVIKLFHNSLADTNCQLTIRHDVAEVLGAHARPDGGPGVRLGPGQLTSGGGGDGEILLSEL